nr:immunoglobulin heavy chain junction region [Macaca mulatta]MOV38462.1 immunoglobulin heavy chain junction region [Macaca mulatta]MOV39231.1 immunoglobulin heavy chain junction region [Macaca mulatta]MOV40062.1 immunoglobulin heavy chain junction region [Macaca mulatta]MOV40882.1 immunoglobulin heavy chain junction region [Macaca mulatta]
CVRDYYGSGSSNW